MGSANSIVDHNPTEDPAALKRYRSDLTESPRPFEKLEKIKSAPMNVAASRKLSNCGDGDDESKTYAYVQEPDRSKKYSKWVYNKTILLPEPNVSKAICWSSYAVAEWIDAIGYPQYKNCFKSNSVTGRKLIYFREIKNYPKIGIQDFNHMKDIARKVEQLLKVPKLEMYDYGNYTADKSLSLPPGSDYEMYLEDKAKSGKVMDFTSFKRYQQNYARRYNRSFGMPDGTRKWRKHAEL